MTEITISLIIGIVIGMVATKLLARRRIRKLETDIMYCQRVINDLTLNNRKPNYEAELDFLNSLNAEKPDRLRLDEDAIRNMMENQTPDEMLMEKVKEITQKNIADENFGVEQLCKELGMSRMQLNRKLKKIVNLSPNQLINDIRMKYAASLLTNGKMNVGEVAFRLGFSSHSYFSSKFKERFGVTPSEYVERENNEREER